MILAPLTIMASFLVFSIKFNSFWVESSVTRIIGSILQSLCNIWIVGYAFYFMIASGCSCRGGCTPSQDQRIEEEEEETRGEGEEGEEMVGMMGHRVYPAL